VTGTCGTLAGHAAGHGDSGPPAETGSAEPAAADPLSAESVRALFGVARRALAEALCDCAAGMDRRTERVDGPFYTVNLTVYQDRRLRASMSGRGESLAAAVVTAARRAAYDRRFGGVLAPRQVDAMRLDLWVLTGMTPFASAGEVLATLDIGRDGVELWLGRKSAYYKPSVGLTTGITDPDLLMRKLARKAGLLPDSWRDPGASIWRTSWEHFVDAPSLAQRPIRMRRLRPTRDAPLDRATLARAVRAAQDRLLAGQAEGGGYLYRYHPLTEKVLARTPSLVRQAGTTYAIARSAAREPDPAHAAALRRSALSGLDFLLGLQAPAAGGGCFLRDPAARRPRGQLGSAALALLALQYGELGDAYERARCGLRTWVLSQQNSDGSFRCWSDTVSVAADGRKQDYFPGEAMLALAHEARRGHAGSASALERGLPWYRAYFRRSPSSAFVPWQVDAWRLAADGTAGPAGQASSAAFVLELADWMLLRQLTADEVSSDLVGGFAAAGRTPGASTATYTEAVIRAFDLAVRLGDAGRAGRYRRAARLGLGFALRLQISPETAEILPAPSLAAGGVTTRLDDFTLRCDYEQHFITACLTALETPRVLD
jgi:AMMECR1 domain-containing protein